MSDEIVVKDSNGNVLSAGDAVQVIKDLKVKGADTLKRGTVFKNIRLTLFGRNLFFYAPNSLMDPELSTSGAGTGSGLVRGLELISAPNTRNMGASIRVTF